MLPPQPGCARRLLLRSFSTIIERQASSYTPVLEVSKNAVQLRENSDPTVQGRHLANLAKTLSDRYRAFILNKDFDVVSRLWFIVMARLIGLTTTNTDNASLFNWKDRIPNSGSVKEDSIKEINIYEIVRLVKYLSFSKIFHENSVFSKSLAESPFLSHLIKSDVKNHADTAPKPSRQSTSFFGRIFTAPPGPLLDNSAPSMPTPCDLTALPTHILAYQWILDSSFNFCIPTEFLSHVLSPPDFINAMRATLLLNLNQFIKINWDIVCFSKLLMYFATFNSHYLIKSPYFSEIILKNLDEISRFLSDNVSSNIKTLKPRNLALIATASGIRGDLMILDCIEKALKGDYGAPTELAMSLHPNHLENICYAFAKLRIVRKGLYKTLASVVEYKFDEFEPVVTLNLIFSFARVNHLDMVEKCLVKRLCSYSVKQLSEVSGKVIANAMQALSSVCTDHEPYMLLLDAVVDKEVSSDLRVIYSDILHRLMGKGMMTEPLDSCVLYQRLTNIANKN